MGWAATLPLDRLVRSPWPSRAQRSRHLVIDEIGLGRLGLPATTPDGPALDPPPSQAGRGFLQRRTADVLPGRPGGVRLKTRPSRTPASLENNSFPPMEATARKRSATPRRHGVYPQRRSRAGGAGFWIISAATVRQPIQNPGKIFSKGANPEALPGHVSAGLASKGCQDAPETDRWMGDMAWLPHRLPALWPPLRPRVIRTSPTSSRLLVSFFTSRRRPAATCNTAGVRATAPFTRPTGIEGNIDAAAPPTVGRAGSRR